MEAFACCSEVSIFCSFVCLFLFIAKKREKTNVFDYMRVNRAALCCKWATSGKKFAVGTSARSIMICSYDDEHDFWVAKSIRKPKSAVTCLAWHPSDLVRLFLLFQILVLSTKPPVFLFCELLAAGGTDFKCRVYNVYDPEVDENADA